MAQETDKSFTVLLLLPALQDVAEQTVDNLGQLLELLGLAAVLVEPLNMREGEVE